MNFKTKSFLVANVSSIMIFTSLYGLPAFNNNTSLLHRRESSANNLSPMKNSEVTQIVFPNSQDPISIMNVSAPSVILHGFGDLQEHHGLIFLKSLNATLFVYQSGFKVFYKSDNYSILGKWNHNSNTINLFFKLSHNDLLVNVVGFN